MGQIWESLTFCRGVYVYNFLIYLVSDILDLIIFMKKHYLNILLPFIGLFVSLSTSTVSGQVSGIMYTLMDPTTYNGNGVLTLSNSTGGDVNRFSIYVESTPNTMGKAAGIGDIEVVSSPPPVEIGNLVWMDTNDDGIQGPNEMGLSGVKVKLFLGGTQVGETMTSATGNFYFTNSNVNMNGATGLQPKTAYTIRVDAGDFPSGKTLSAMLNTGGPGQPDVRDNDAALVGANAEISVMTGNYGENDHSFDIAFKVAACTPPSAPVLSVTNNTCSPVAAGSINVVTACGAGSTIEYSTNNGGSWSTTVPTYGTSPITVIARCVLNSDATCVSASSAPVTTAPVTCCVAPSAPVLSVTNNTCSPVTAGSINVVTACGAGSTIQYSTNNGGTWSTSIPVYGSLPMTVIARCASNSDATCVSATSAPVTTAPVAPPFLDANDATICESSVGAGATVNLTTLVQNPDGGILAFSEGGNPIATPSAANLSAGVHTISVTSTVNPGNCSATVMFVVTVDAPDAPIALCSGQTYTLTAPASITNVEWFRNGLSVGTSNTYIVTQPGVYTFTGEDATTCTANSCCPKEFVEGDCLSVGSTVWYDVNDNGIYEQATENPIPGVTVQLYTGAGVFVASDITDSNGDYFFGNLPAGSYYVQLPATNPALTGYTSSSVTDTDREGEGTAGEDNDDNGVQSGGAGTVVVSPTFTLTANMEPIGELGSGGIQDDALDFAGVSKDNDGDMTIDFGFAQVANITHNKTLSSVVEQPDGSYNVTYLITVTNTGGASSYHLYDKPEFESHISINSASFTTNAPGNAGGSLSTTMGFNNPLATNQAIANGATHTYTVVFNVTLDLEIMPMVYETYLDCSGVYGGTPGAGRGQGKRI